MKNMTALELYEHYGNLIRTNKTECLYFLWENIAAINAVQGSSKDSMETWGEAVEDQEIGNMYDAFYGEEDDEIEG